MVVTDGYFFVILVHPLKHCWKEVSYILISIARK